MGSDAQGAPASAFEGRVPSIKSLVNEVIASLAVAAHAYMADENCDLSSAGVAIDVASLAFDRIKEHLEASERLAITQLLTETRLDYVRRREAR